MDTVSVEHVMVVPTGTFHSLGHFQGFSVNAGKYLDTLLDPANTLFLPRTEMESDPGYKQLIPYCIFRHTDEAGTVTLFNYTRGAGQGESRLHNKVSIGIGGHVSADDRESTEVYREGMRRELAEEVTIGTDFTEQCIGLINDDETEVGKVHLGIVHLIDVTHPAVKPNEPELLQSGFLTIPELFDRADDMESWSRICLESYFGE